MRNERDENSRRAESAISNNAPTRCDSRDALGFNRNVGFRSLRTGCRRRSPYLSCRRFLLTRMQRAIGERLAKSGEHWVMHDLGSAVQILAFLWMQLAKYGRALKRSATEYMLRMPEQSDLMLCLLAPPLHENPLRDARLHIHLDQFVEDFNHLLAQVCSVIQTRQLERFKRCLRAGCNVLQQHFRRLHDVLHG